MHVCSFLFANSLICLFFYNILVLRIHLTRCLGGGLVNQIIIIFFKVFTAPICRFYFKNRIKDMKKKIFISLLIITAVGGLGFAATRAFFTDRETSTGSTFTVGTMDLAVGDANGSNVDPFVIEGIGASGDISGSKTWTVRNTGSLPGRVYFKLDNVVNYDNGCNEPEALVDTTCGTPGAGQGELGNVITAKVAWDGVEKVNSTLATANQGKIGTDWSALTPIILQGGESKTLKMEWATGQNDYGNEIQSDSLTFDSVFDLEQLVTPSAVPTL